MISLRVLPVFACVAAIGACEQPKPAPVITTTLSYEQLDDAYKACGNTPSLATNIACYTRELGPPTEIGGGKRQWYGAKREPDGARAPRVTCWEVQMNDDNSGGFGPAPPVGNDALAKCTQRR
jgi:hypothetical protein